MTLLYFSSIAVSGVLESSSKVKKQDCYSRQHPTIAAQITMKGLHASNQYPSATESLATAVHTQIYYDPGGKDLVAAVNSRRGGPPQTSLCCANEVHLRNCTQNHA
eukprot:3609533-Amphidinium_carterae.1